VKKGEIIELSVTDIGSEGKGIGRAEGNLVVFVNNAVPGDKIRAQILKLKKKFAEAKISEMLEESPYRIIPECAHFGTCNGCKMQNIEYDRQLIIKRRSVINAFERIGGFKDIQVPEVMPSNDIFYYRNKLEFSFSCNKWLTEKHLDDTESEKNFALGFHMPGFIDKVIDINECFLQSKLSNNILNITKEFFKSIGESIYSAKTHEGYLKYLIIRESKNTNDLLINLISSTENKVTASEYADFVFNKISDSGKNITIVNSISTTRAQAAIADYSNVVYGTGFITEKLGRYTFKITPNSFFQTNSKQCENLFDVLLELADFDKNEKVLDLYCGCGAISIYISDHVESVMGVELNDDSIQMAKENAESNNVKNCEFDVCDVKDFLEKSLNMDSENKMSIILDPPRSGLHPKAAEYLLQYEAKKIIYVSCNPATQARDINLLSSKYDITKMEPVDMFPHTFHIENIVRLDLKK